MAIRLFNVRHLLVLLATMLAPALPLDSLLAQKPGGITPQAACPPEGCITGVSVTPDGGNISKIVNTSGVTTFIVRNTGNITTPFTMTCSATNVTCGTVTPSSASLAAGTIAEVDVAYTARTVNGRLNLRASNGGTATDQGYYNVTVTNVGVAVTPDGGSASPRPVNSGPYSEQFTINNTGTAQVLYTLACAGASGITCTGTSVPSIALAPATSGIVTASYSVGAAGTGTLSLTATSTGVSDAGSYNVPIVAPSPQPPVIAVDPFNPGATVERGICVTAALGPSAASECGDLRLVHALPSTRTLTRDRAPTLLYNSQAAHSYPSIAAVVTLPLIASVPDSVTGTLTIGGVNWAHGKWTGSDWAPAKARRVVLAFDALSLATGVYTGTLEVRTWFGTTSKPTSTTFTVAVVNRSGSPFGAGWWLAGLEELSVGTMLWTGGDGSVRQYQPSGTPNVWVAPDVDHPDTLKWNGTEYVRFDMGGLQVRFDATGKHVATINRQGHRTSFAYVSGQLSTITLPVPTTGPARTYQFAYDATARRLSSVTSPRITVSLNRVTSFAGSNGQITSITEHDGSIVRFGYDAGFANRIVSRTDRRGTVTTYGFNTVHRVIQSSTAMGAGNPPIVIGLRPVESLGLPTSSVDTALAYTRVDGPRTDVADTSLIWTDRFGAPRKSMDALGFVTTIDRSPVWPALAIRIVRPTAWKLEATYDIRGNLSSTTDFGFSPNPVTRYEWDQTWDALTKVTLPSGDSVVMSVDPATGNRSWQQDGRGAQTRVNFGYDGLNRLTSTTRPGAPAEIVAYDVTVGNVESVKTPKGYDVKYFSDGIGRVKLISSRLDTLVSAPPSAGSALYQDTFMELDVVGRDTLNYSVAPQMSLTVLAETLWVRKFYNPNSQLDSLWRWSGPDRANIDTIRTRWRYDAAGRTVAEVAPDGVKDSTTYDPAGNAVGILTRRGHAISQTFDAMNRVLTRTLPSVSYASRNSNLVSQPAQAPYPAYQIAGDVQTFTYDALGRLKTANNGDARITRSYYQNGLLQIEKLDIRTLGTQDFTTHSYSSANFWDVNGRRTELDIPAQLAPNGTLNKYVKFTYTPQLGSLASVTDILNNRYDLIYNDRGELATLTFPGQYNEKFAYDVDGRLAADTILNTGGTTFPRLLTPTVRATTYLYDARDRLLKTADPNGFQDTLQLTYSGLGSLANSHLTERGQQLVGTEWFAARFANVETFSLDAMGNRYSGVSRDTTTNMSGVKSNGFSTHSSTFQVGTGRILQDLSASAATTFIYDAAGNTAFSSNPGVSNGAPAEERATFYAADGTVRAVDWRWLAQPGAVFTSKKYAFEEYRYDALGRRVLLWSKKTCDERGLVWYEAAECKTSLVRRTVWDGDQEMVEIQMPGGTAANEVALYENDTAPVQLPSLSTTVGTVDRNQYFGRVVYAPGRGTDMPMSVTRINYEYQHTDAGGSTPYTLKAPITISPFWDQKGDAPIGVFTTGARLLCNPPTTTGVCVGVLWPYFWSAFDRHRISVWDNWQGSLLERKRDKTGLEYKRNRYYDPATGRFTQEDPIGLAGGMNLYGFAAGDPVNFSDPFGLWAEDGCCRITNWSALKHVIDKHVKGHAGSGWNMWADMDEKSLRQVIDNTVRNGRQVASEVVNGETRFTFERNWKTALGTRGEQIARVVISESGELRTAFPVKNAMLPIAERAAGAGMLGAVLRGASRLGVLGGIVGAIVNVGLSPTELH